MKGRKGLGRLLKKLCSVPETNDNVTTLAAGYNDYVWVEGGGGKGVEGWEEEEVERFRREERMRGRVGRGGEGRGVDVAVVLLSVTR